MKKYNLSKIMKRAWNIKGEHKDNIFSMCLKMAWEEARNQESQSWVTELPETDEYRRLLKKNFPALTGTKKQVEWAEEIREGIRKELSYYSRYFLSDGRPCALFNVLKQGNEAVIKDILASVSHFDNETVKKERIASRISAYKDLAKRIKRYNEIMSNSSAVFWIDNRRNCSDNYMDKKFKEFIDN